MSATKDSLNSSLREGMLEHMLLGVLMREAWIREKLDFDVLWPVTDAAGYDFVMVAGGITRHVQTKASFLGATTATQKINKGLAMHPSGCVI